MPGKGKHSAKWDRCMNDILDKQDKGKAPKSTSPYAVCTASLGHQAALPFQEHFAKRLKAKKEAISASSNAGLTRGKKESALIQIVRLFREGGPGSGKKGHHTDKQSQKGVLLASSGSIEGIQKMIGQYWYSKNVNLKPSGEKTFDVYQGDKKMNDFQVTQDKGRFRFEGFPEGKKS